jgi:hypothetical protein
MPPKKTHNTAKEQQRALRELKRDIQEEITETLEDIHNATLAQHTQFFKTSKQQYVAHSTPSPIKKGP